MSAFLFRSLAALSFTLYPSILMQELIEKIKEAAGLNDTQATAAAEATKAFIRGKVPPMFTGLVDQLFAGKLDPASAMKAAQSQQSGFMDKAQDMMQSIGNKVQEIGLSASDKATDFAHQANEYLHEWANKSGGWSQEAFDKVKELFSDKKPDDNNATK